MKKSAFLLCIFVACLFIFIACDQNNGSGGGQSLGGIEPQNAGTRAVPVARLAGPEATAGQLAAFECQSARTGANIIARQWVVTGGGSLVGGANDSAIKVKAARSGSYTVKLRVLSHEKVWSYWAEKTVNVDLPDFVITLDTLSYGQAVDGNPASGSAGTFIMAGYQFGYERYLIRFRGDTSGLPAQVPVTIKWNMQKGSLFRWAAPDANAGSQTVKVPIKGGSVGFMGSVINVAMQRPMISGVPAYSEAGTVIFSAPGVDPLTITVVR